MNNKRSKDVAEGVKLLIEEGKKAYKLGYEDGKLRKYQEVLKILEEMKDDCRDIIQSLWDTMEDVSKDIVIGKTDLTESVAEDEVDSIPLHNGDCVTTHDQQHISQICEQKRFIFKLNQAIKEAK